MMVALALMVAIALPPRGVECVSIVPDGPAYRAGLRERDVVVQFDGHPTRSPEELNLVLMNCVRPGQVPLRTRSSTLLIDVKALGALPHHSQDLGATFEPEISAALKPARTKAIALEQEKKYEEAALAYRAVVDRAIEAEDWMNAARCAAGAGRCEFTLHPMYVKDASETRIKWMEEVHRKVAAAIDPSAELVMRLGLQDSAYTLDAAAMYTPLGPAALKNWAEIKAALSELKLPIARAFLIQDKAGWTQTFGGIGGVYVNTIQCRDAAYTLQKIPDAADTALWLMGYAAYTNTAFAIAGYEASYAEGLVLSRETIAFARRVKNRPMEAWGWYTQGLGALERGNDALALESFQSAREIVRSAAGDDAVALKNFTWPMSFCDAVCRTGEAIVYARRSAFDDADAAVQEVLTGPLPPWTLGLAETEQKTALRLGREIATATRIYVLAVSGRSEEASAALAAFKPTSEGHGFYCPILARTSMAEQILRSSKLPEAGPLPEALWGPPSPAIVRSVPRTIMTMHRLRARAVVRAKSGDRDGAMADLAAVRGFIDTYRPDDHDRAEFAMDEARVLDYVGASKARVPAWRQAVAAYRAEAANALGESGRQYAGAQLAAAGDGWISAAVAIANPKEALLAFESTRAASLANATAAQGSAEFEVIQASLKKLDEARLRRADALSTIEYLNIRLKEAETTPTEKSEFEAGISKAGSDAAAAQTASEKLEIDVQRAFAAAESKLKVPAVSPESAVARLPSDAGFVGYAIGERSVTVIAVRRGAKPIARNLDIDPQAVTKAIYAHRDLVTDRHSALRAVTESGARLGRVLLPGAVRQYLKGCQRLVVAPDGPLWELPFASLRLTDGKKTGWLGETYPLQYAQSLAVYTDDRRPKSRNTEALVVGDPAYSAETAGPDAERGGLWAAGKPPVRLPATKAEADAVAAVYKSTAITGGDATEAAVRSKIERARIVHLATHGYFHPTVPGASGILLAPGQAGAGREDDGALQATEVLRGLKLDADLVVLSACETARGRYLQGEGVIGMTRSLQIAGARTICASQWRVADASTATLMTALHRRVAKGIPVDEALRQAMVELMKTSRHPYYWSPFLLIGRAAKT